MLLLKIHAETSKKPPSSTPIHTQIAGSKEEEEKSRKNRRRRTVEERERGTVLIKAR